MAFRRMLLLTILTILALASHTRADSRPPWKELVGQAGLQLETVRLYDGRWRGGAGGTTTSTFDTLWNNWRQVRPYGRRTARNAVDATDGNPARLIALAARQIDAGIPDAGIGAIEKSLRRSSRREKRRMVEEGRGGDSARALSAAIVEIHQHYGKPLDREARKQLEAKVAQLPAASSEAAALVLRCAIDALRHRDRAIRECGPPEREKQLFRRVRKFANWHRLDSNTLKQLRKVRLKELVRGGIKLAAAVNVAKNLLGDHSGHTMDGSTDTSFKFEWETPYGWVVLDNTPETHHQKRPYLLIIDLAGDDRYHDGGGTAAWHKPVSVLLDMQGNDEYDGGFSYSFGAGILGYGFLLDAAGNDRYSHHACGLGLGSAGIGLLFDMAGDDAYDTDHLGQGAGAFGVGILADSGGADTYDCYNLAQGYGGVRGCGMLVDAGDGNDRYTANDTDIQSPSPQTKKHNTSMAQGAGFGRRAHPGDGMSLAGGVGLLVDAAGNDAYSCGVFGQGTAYWYSTGILADLAGNDRYEGIWYVQGAAAHYAVAGLLDEGGDDIHRAKMATSLAAGHDYSIAALWDAAGNDEYHGPVTIGWGNANGIGVFVDMTGDDRYDARKLAGTNRSRKRQPAFGIFADCGGNDKFPESDRGAGSGQMWKRQEGKNPRAWGLGMDR